MAVTALDIELAVATHFGCRQNIIVPNISWGLWIHECDLLIVTQAGYAIEVEIKVNRADLKKDAQKRHGHNDPRIKALYFAIPEKLMSASEFIPERAGIITVGEGGFSQIRRKPALNRQAQPLTPTDHLKVAHLGAMRIWRLKHTIKNYVRGYYDKPVDSYEDNRCG